jgi:hypothetical protein
MPGMRNAQASRRKEQAQVRAALTRRRRAAAGPPDPNLPVGTDTLPAIHHIVVLMMENHSYDAYLGALERGGRLPARYRRYPLGLERRDRRPPDPAQPARGHVPGARVAQPVVACEPRAMERRGERRLRPKLRAPAPRPPVALA